MEIINYLIHHIDGDGYFSGFIVNNFSNIEFNKRFEFNYEKKVPKNDKYSWYYEIDDNKQYNYYFVDITPSINWIEMQLEEFPNNKIIVIDHHPICEKLSKYGNVELHYDKNVSASKIAYDLFGTNIVYKLKNDIKLNNLEQILHKIDMYDTWSFDELPHKSSVKRDILAFQEYVKTLLPQGFDMFCYEIKNLIHYLNDYKSSLEIGRQIVSVKEMLSHKTLDKCLIDTSSDNIIKLLIEGVADYYLFDLIRDKFKSFNQDILYVCFNYNLKSKMCNFSVRSILKSKDNFENSAQNFAEQMGGGGHLNAGGFKLNYEKASQFINTFIE